VVATEWARCHGGVRLKVLRLRGRTRERALPNYSIQRAALRAAADAER
jgi:hypothetical protein